MSERVGGCIQASISHCRAATAWQGVWVLVSLLPALLLYAAPEKQPEIDAVDVAGGWGPRTCAPPPGELSGTEGVC
jgi:hypothetical protein